MEDTVRMAVVLLLVFLSSVGGHSILVANGFGTNAAGIVAFGVSLILVILFFELSRKS